MIEFEPEERALIESYLRVRPGGNRAWLVELVLGAVMCLAALALLALAPRERFSLALLVFVAGLVVMAHAMDERKRKVLAGVIQKYHRAFEATRQGPRSAR